MISITISLPISPVENTSKLPPSFPIEDHGDRQWCWLKPIIGPFFLLLFNLPPPRPHTLVVRFRSRYRRPCDFYYYYLGWRGQTWWKSKKKRKKRERKEGRRGEGMNTPPLFVFGSRFRLWPTPANQALLFSNTNEYYPLDGDIFLKLENTNADHRRLFFRRSQWIRIRIRCVIWKKNDVKSGMDIIYCYSVMFYRFFSFFINYACFRNKFCPISRVVIFFFIIEYNSFYSKCFIRQNRLTNK